MSYVARTECAWCNKEIPADSSCAGVEVGNDDIIFYFCSQDHAAKWGKDTGTNES